MKILVVGAGAVGGYFGGRLKPVGSGIVVMQK
jgi:ketopantoate reductase